MQCAEVKHVPVGRHLFHERGKLGLKLRIEDRVVFEDQHALVAQLAGFLDHRDVAEQTAVRARRVSSSSPEA